MPTFVIYCDIVQSPLPWTKFPVARTSGTRTGNTSENVILATVLLIYFWRILVYQLNRRHFVDSWHSRILLLSINYQNHRYPHSQTQTFETFSLKVQKSKPHRNILTMNFIVRTTGGSLCFQHDCIIYNY